MTASADDDAVAQVRIAITNVPDAETGRRIARVLVEERLAACVNLLAPCRSVYRWQGAIEEADEVPMVIKTGADRFERLRARLIELHPYDLPELLAWTPGDAHGPYARWVVDETGG